jgi:CRISPR-associated endonuclease/helicase Cas3
VSNSPKQSLTPQFVAHTPPQGQPEKWHDLLEHLQDVAQGAKQYAAKFGAEDLGFYAGLWHDLGKFNPEFQHYLKECDRANQSGSKPPARGPRHAVHGAILAAELCPTLAPIIYGHHAGLPNFSGLDNELANPQSRKVYQTVIKLATEHIEQLEAPEDLMDSVKNPPADELAEDLWTRFLFSCLIDADRLDTEQFAELEQARSRQEMSSKYTIQQLWEAFDAVQTEFTQGIKNSESEVNKVRQEVLQACKNAAEKPRGIFRLCVPTGGGKTLSSLAFALKHANSWSCDRIIFAVPYTSIIEQTAEVYRETFQSLGKDVVLEHHSAIQEELRAGFTEEERREGEEVSQTAKIQAKLATQNWDAKLIVTTTVQLFESLFSNRTSRCRKLHNIINSVIVLDEVQTLPTGLLTPIVQMLEELSDRYNVTVVLCTATQPALEGESPYFTGFHKVPVQDIIDPEIAKEHFRKLRRVVYQLPQKGKQWQWSDLAAEVQAETQSLVILNTRVDALAVIQELGISSEVIPNQMPVDAMRQVFESSSVLHLSTLLCGRHRSAVLREVKRRLRQAEPCTLVSTQVVEAGVNLDFPVVFRAIGPLDRIVQAAGRCNREGERQEPGRVIIFDPVEGKVPGRGSEYDRAMQEARRILEEIQPDYLHEPDIFERYFRSIYQLISNRGELDLYQIQEKRRNGLFKDVDRDFRLIKQDTVPVIINFDHQSEDLLNQIRRRKLWSSDRRQLQPYIVNLPRYVFDKTQDRIEIAPDVWQWDGTYDPICGVPIETTAQTPIYSPMFLCQ